MNTAGLRHTVLVAAAALALVGCPGTSDVDAGDVASADVERTDGGSSFDAQNDVPASDDRTALDAADARTSPTDAPVEVEPRRDAAPLPDDVATADEGAPVCRPPLGTCARGTDCCSLVCTTGTCRCVPMFGSCTFNAACCSGHCNIPTSQCLCGEVGALCMDDPDCCGSLHCSGGTCTT